MKNVYFVKVVKPAECQSPICISGGKCLPTDKELYDVCQECFLDLKRGFEELGDELIDYWNQGGE